MRQLPSFVCVPGWGYAVTTRAGEVCGLSVSDHRQRADSSLGNSCSVTMAVRIENPAALAESKDEVFGDRLSVCWTVD